MHLSRCCAFTVSVMQICAAVVRAELTLICLEQRVGEYIAWIFVHFKVFKIIQTSMGSFSCVCVCL